MNTLNLIARYAALLLEAGGVAAILTGALLSSVRALIESIASTPGTLDRFRKRLGRSILLGLEFLVAGDIIDTVALRPTLLSVAVLASIVLIRTFLSFTLEMEMTGRWPWQGQTAGERAARDHQSDGQPT